MFEELNNKGKKSALSIAKKLTIASIIILILFGVLAFTNKNDTLKIVFIIMVVVLVAGGTFNWIAASKYDVSNKINAFCKKTNNPDSTLRLIEKTWSEGYDFGAGKISNDFLLCSFKTTFKIIPLKDMVWAYKFVNKQNGAEVGISVIINYSYGKSKSCRFGDHNAIDRLLGYIIQNFSQVVVGYKKEIHLLYRKKDFEAMKAYARSSADNNK